MPQPTSTNPSASPCRSFAMQWLATPATAWDAFCVAAYIVIPLAMPFLLSFAIAVSSDASSSGWERGSTLEEVDASPSPTLEDAVFGGDLGSAILDESLQHFTGRGLPPHHARHRC